jgi:predicted DNA-binding antitoxin AbrB/MazE fold protein
MLTMRGRVRGGRLLVDEPVDLPDGTEVEVAIVDDAKDMDEEERALLEQDLREALAEVQRGEAIPAEQVLAELRSSGEA